MQLLDENIGLRERVAELELIAEQRYAHMRTYHATVSGLETQLHDAWQMRAEWKRRAERWKVIAATYRMALKAAAEMPKRWDYRLLLKISWGTRPEWFR